MSPAGTHDVQPARLDSGSFERILDREYQHAARKCLELDFSLQVHDSVVVSHPVLGVHMINVFGVACRGIFDEKIGLISNDFSIVEVNSRGLRIGIAVQVVGVITAELGASNLAENQQNHSEHLSKSHLIYEVSGSGQLERLNVSGLVVLRSFRI